MRSLVTIEIEWCHHVSMRLRVGYTLQANRIYCRDVIKKGKRQDVKTEKQ